MTNITPASGPAAGGTPVTITGTDLTGTTAVTIGGAAATLGTVGDTSITATTPPGTAGAKNVVITTPGGTATGVGAFTYLAAPAVTSVSVPADGTYKAGDALNFTVTYDSAITVTGAPSLALTLNTGGTVQASYVSGSGTANLLFRYIVASGNLDTDGITVGSSLALNSGTLKDATNVDASLTLGGVAATTGVKIDAVAPTVTSVVVPPNGTYVAGQNLDFAVSFPESVFVNAAGGTPYIPVTLSTGTVSANYLSGSGSATLTFRHTVVTGNYDPDGIAVGTTITANGGTIQDSAGNNATTALNSVGSTSAVLVNAIKPTATTDVASNITKTTATLGGTISSNGDSTTATFDYGKTFSYGSTITAAQSPLAPGASGASVSAAISGLDCNTLYHFRVNGSNTGGTSNGSDVSFTTSACVAGAPAGVSATAGVGQATVTFIAPVSDGGASITGYTVTSSPGGFSGTGAGSPITVTGLNNGTAYTFTVTATNSAGTSLPSLASSAVTPKTNQTISFTQPANQSFGTTPTLSATSDSGLTVTFTSSTTGVCTITSGGTLAFLTAGACTIDADQAGNGAYFPATTVSQTFSVGSVAPSAPAIGTATAGTGQATVAFTAPSFTGGTSITGYMVTSNPGNITASGAASPITITGLTNGTAYTFTVTATNSAGTGVASAASNSVTPKAAQTITFANPGTQNFGTTPTLTASASGGTVTFTSSTTGVCTVTSGGVLTFVTPGTCTINADQAGNGTYLPASTVSNSFTVNAVAPNAPTIGIATAGNTQATVSFAAPANTGGTAITSYTVTSSPGNITASGTASPITVTGLTNGTTYTFTATATNSAGTSTASAASNSVTPILSAPVANAASATVAYGSSANVITPTLGGGTAASLTVSIQPAHGTASVSGLTLIYTPVATYSGTDSFTYTATNAGGTSAPATVTVTVNPQAPIAGAVSMTVEIGSSNNVVPLALTGGAVASVAVASAPGHGSAAVSGTIITYTPTAGYMGTDSFTYTATNAGGTSAPGTVTILVNSRPDPTKDTEVIALLNAQVQTATRFGQTQIGNFQSHLEGLHARSRALSQDGQRFSSRGKAPVPAETTATSLTEFSSGTNTGTVASTPSALSSPRSSRLSTDARCQAGNMQNCMASGGMRPAGDGMDSLVLGALTSAGTRSDWWPWPTLSVNGSSKDLLGSGLNVWSAGTINVGKQSENDTRFTTSGISVGGDNPVTDKLILGIGAGFGHERQKIGSNDTKNRGDSYSIVAYGSYQPEEGFFIDGLIGYGHLAFDAERYVTATGDFAQSERKGSQWFSSLSGGYEYVDGKFLFSPYGRLDLIHTRLDETTESGAGTSNLTYRAQTSRSTKLSLGLRTETSFEIDSGTVKPSLRVEYQHDFAEPGAANMVYADDANGTIYQLDMVNTDRNTMVLGLGLDFALRKSWQTGFSYKFSHGSSSSSQMQSFGVYLRRAF